jgi:hypothetical protein
LLAILCLSVANVQVILHKENQAQILRHVADYWTKIDVPVGDMYG